MSTKTFNPGTVIRSNSQYSESLSNLELKLDQIKRDISYFDVYNITTVVTDPNDFPSQMSTLPFGQSLIVNTNSSFNHNQTMYNRGDILLKTNSGSLVHIKAQTGGIYYPSGIKDNNGVYTLQYSYSPAPPTEEEVTTNKTDSTAYVTDFSKTIEIRNLSVANTTSIYGSWLESEENGKVNIIGNSDVKPMVQFYFVTMEEDTITDMEEVVIDYNLTSTTEGWTIEPVDSNFNSNYWVKVK